MHVLSRREALALLAALGSGRALAQVASPGGAFPQRPIRLVVPNAPAGPSDIVARALATPLGGVLGQPIVVDNRPGASGAIGTHAVVNAPADGYTVLVTSRSNHVLAPLVQKSATFQPQRDLVPVALALRALGLFATNAQTKLRTFREFVREAKARPGRLNYGSAGVGATNHVAVEQLKALAGIDLAHVPYKGSGPLIAALMANEVQFALLDFSSAQAGIQGGNVVPLVQTGARRLRAAPDLPTLGEAGFAGFDPSFWIGLAVPKGTPDDVVARLNRAVEAALADTRVKAYAQANGWELVGGPPKALADTIASDLAQFPALVERLDLKAG